MIVSLARLLSHFKETKNGTISSGLPNLSQNVLSKPSLGHCDLTQSKSKFCPTNLSQSSLCTSLLASLINLRCLCLWHTFLALPNYTAVYLNHNQIQPKDLMNKLAPLPSGIEFVLPTYGIGIEYYP